MLLHEAIAARTMDKNGVTRKSWDIPGSKFRTAILPTETPDCCIVCSNVNRSPYRGWQPTLEDLTADDWIPCETV